MQAFRQRGALDLGGQINRLVLHEQPRGEWRMPDGSRMPSARREGKPMPAEPTAVYERVYSAIGGCLHLIATARPCRFRQHITTLGLQLFVC